MIDLHVQNLLRTAVDTPVKLQIVQILHDQSHRDITARAMAERACRDIWSVSQAMDELAQDGILRAVPAVSEPTYLYHPRAEYIEPIRSLLRGYDDPLQRASLRQFLRELASYAAFRRSGEFVSAW